MKIYDEGNRDVAPFHLKRLSAKKIKTVYSDHNPIIMETNLVMKQIDAEEKKKRRVLTEEGKVKYRQELEEKKSAKYGTMSVTCKKHTRHGRQRWKRLRQNMNKYRRQRKKELRKP